MRRWSVVLVVIMALAMIGWEFPPDVPTTEEWRVHPGNPGWSGSNPPSLASYCQGVNGVRVSVEREGVVFYKTTSHRAPLDHWVPMCPGWDSENKFIAEAVRTSAFAGWFETPPLLPGDKLVFTTSGDVGTFVIPREGNFARDVYIRIRP